tara:strand:+ start:4219 stop:4476 length:258 start_codon:yes stop_codon:yes gene_type:complete
MKPIGKYILIKEVVEEIETGSGLLLGADEVNQLRYKKGMVIFPGTDVTVIEQDDDIYYDSRAGHTMLLGDNTFTIIKEQDVVVVL